MWPLGSLTEEKDGSTSLHLLYAHLRSQYGFTIHSDDSRSRLLVLAFAPKGSTLNDIILKHAEQINFASSSNWDLICPGFGVTSQKLDPSRREDDLAETDLEFSGGNYISFVKELEDNVGTRLFDQGIRLNKITRLTGGGLLFAEARIGESEMVIDWGSAWAVEARKLEQSRVQLHEVFDIITESHGNKDSGSPLVRAIHALSIWGKNRGTKELASRIDPSGAPTAVFTSFIFG